MGNTQVNLPGSITSSISMPDTNLTSILLANQQNGADIMKAVMGVKVYIADKTVGALITNDNSKLLKITTFNSSNNQLWTLVDLNNGFYSIRSVSDPSGELNRNSGGPVSVNNNSGDQGINPWKLNNSVNGFTLTSSGQWRGVVGGDGQAPALMISPGTIGGPVSSMTLTDVSAKKLTGYFGQVWDIIIAEPALFCSKVNPTYGFGLNICGKMDPSPTKNTLAQAYCSKQINGKSALITNANCQDWCNNNSAACDTVMTTYCVNNPTAPECACIYANNQQDYKDFMLKNPNSGGSASCYAGACKGTNLITALIPQSLQAAMRGCPSLSTQTTNQNVNVGAGATILGGVNLAATQTASGATPQQTVAAVQPTQQKNNTLMIFGFIYFIFMAVMIVMFMMPGGAVANSTSAVIPDIVVSPNQPNVVQPVTSPAITSV